MSEGGARQLVERARRGDQLAVARLLTRVERSLADAADVLAAVGEMPRQGRSVGFAGPPGVGKSTLVGAVVTALVARDRRVAVIANDPTSFGSGGALLGDRIRMRSLGRDRRVFIRSAAARDPLRSLRATTFAAVELLRRIGFDEVLVEAVGAGQSDIGTRHVAETTVLVLAPDSGDAVQAMKSGVMEVADVFVVNKSDLPHARETLLMLRRESGAFKRLDGWVPPVVAVSAAEETGLDELLEALDRHRRHGLTAPGPPIAEAVTDLVTYEVVRRLREELPRTPGFAAQLEAIEGGESIVRASLALVDGLLGGPALGGRAPAA